MLRVAPIFSSLAVAMLAMATQGASVYTYSMRKLDPLAQLRDAPQKRGKKAKGKRRPKMMKKRRKRAR